MRLTTAIVLGGGGARGSYQIGVWRALNEIGVKFNIITGTSVGALNGALMAQNDLNLAYDLWREIDNKQILDIDFDYDLTNINGFQKTIGGFLGEAVKNKGISSKPLHDLLKANIDEEKIRKSNIDFGLVITKLNGIQGKEVFLKDIPKGSLVDYIMASASFFPAMQSYKIGDEDYVDGGYYDNIPETMAMLSEKNIDAKLSTMIVVDLKSVGMVRKADIPDYVKKYNIYSEWDLGAILIFDSGRATRNINLGYLECKKAFGLLEGNKYSFEKGEIAKCSDYLEPKIKAILHKVKINLFYTPIEIQDEIILSELKKRLNKSKEYIIEAKDIVLFGAESAGEILDIPPDLKYNFETFNEFIYKNDQNDPDNKLALSEKDVVNNLLDGIMPIKRIDVYKNVLRIISKNSYTDTEKTILDVCSRLYVSEFMAGVYVSALLNTKAK